MDKYITKKMAKKKVPEAPAEEQVLAMKGEIPFVIKISKTKWDVMVNTNMQVQFVAFGYVEGCMAKIIETNRIRFEEEQKLPPAKRTLTRTKLNDLIKTRNFLADCLSEMLPLVYDNAEKAALENPIEVVPESTMKILNKDGN